MTKQTSLQATKQTTGARDPFDGFQQDYGLQQGGDGEGGERKTAATGGKLLQQALQQAQDELRQDRMGSRGGGKAVEHIVYASEVCVCACVWVYVSLCTCVCVCVHACV